MAEKMVVRTGLQNCPNLMKPIGAQSFWRITGFTSIQHKD